MNDLTDEQKRLLEVIEREKRQPVRDYNTLSRLVKRLVRPDDREPQLFAEDKRRFGRDATIPGMRSAWWEYCNDDDP
jgi:hypothetical protein